MCNLGKGAELRPIERLLLSGHSGIQVPSEVCRKCETFVPESQGQESDMNVSPRSQLTVYVGTGPRAGEGATARDLDPGAHTEKTEKL